jgi:hypothetical protein
MCKLTIISKTRNFISKREIFSRLNLIKSRKQSSQLIYSWTHAGHICRVTQLDVSAYVIEANVVVQAVSLPKMEF